MMWQRIRLCSHVIHVCMGLRSILSQWVHLKIQVALNSNVLQIQNKLSNIIKIVLYVSFDVDIGFH